MYSTCLFCNANLGANEVIEHFPVGRRLAFDAVKGRLWVVCRRCERWNLSPLEERWEAIEEAERRFSQTRMRVSTDNIGMARLSEGLELVRIGPALRPEMAAWRYGDQFGRRRRRAIAIGTVGVVGVGGLMVVPMVTGVLAGGGWGIWQLVSSIYSNYQSRRVRTRIRIPEVDDAFAVRRAELDAVALVRVEEGWGLQVPAIAKRRRPAADRNVTYTLTGDDARRAAAKLLPAINTSGGSRQQVQSAVRMISEADTADGLFMDFARPDDRSRRLNPQSSLLSHFPREYSLALEMAAHEEQERRAMEGELALLEAAWREAEEVARIADNLLVPEDANRRIEEMREAGKGGGGTGEAMNPTGRNRGRDEG